MTNKITFDGEYVLEDGEVIAVNGWAISRVFNTIRTMKDGEALVLNARDDPNNYAEILYKTTGE